MKFFKKKKSDKDLSKPFESLVPIDIPVQAMSSPALVMPKPRKFLTPTRAILGRFDKDKTQVEDTADEADMIYPQKISPILKLEDEEDFLNKLLNEQEAEANRALDSLSLAVKKLPVTKKKSFVMQPPTNTLIPQFYDHQEIERKPVNFIQEENEQEQVLQALRKQIELMEQQRIKDREEWRIKEQELLDNRQKMMETLQQTKEQLNQVLRERDEAYQQQLLESPSIPQLEQDREEPKRTVNKSRSEEHLRTRSSSRSTYYEDYIPRKIYYNDERSISRKSSSASTKSGYSPASTLVQRRRSRARSIDGKEIFMEDPRMYTKSPYYYDDDEEEYHRYHWQPPPVYYHTRQQAVDYRRGYPRQQHYSYN